MTEFPNTSNLGNDGFEHHDDPLAELIELSDELTPIPIDQIVQLANEAYDDQIGETGRDVWKSITVPSAIAVYGRRPLTLAFVLSDIIEKASYLKVQEVEQFLRDYTSQDAVAFASNKEARQKESRKLEEKTHQYLQTTNASEMELRAVVILGSRAIDEQRLDSDLDIFIVSEKEDIENFYSTIESDLLQAIGIHSIPGVDIMRHASMSKLQILRDDLKSSYRVVAKNDVIRQQIEGALALE